VAVLVVPSSLVVALAAGTFAQAPAPAKPAAPQQPAPAQPKPAQPQPTPPATGAPAPAPRTPARRATQPAGRSGIAITVTDAQGATIEGVQVEVMGPTERSGTTNDSGQVNFPGLQASVYRLRFSGDPVVTFEREVTLRAGQIADLDIMLSRAPAPKQDAPAPAPASPPPSSASLGPGGMPQTLFIPDVLEKDFIKREPRRESLLSCSGNTRTTMVQLNDPQPERLYADADAVYYVLGGEGTMRLNGKDTKLMTNSFVSVPRGVSHAFTRRGNRTLVVLAVLNGEPCEEAR
jgi:hypothetical protein